MAVNELRIPQPGGRGDIAAIDRPTYVDVRVLAASVEEIHTVPADANYVVFSALGEFWVAYDTTVAIPAVDITDGTAPELNPGARWIKGVTLIHLISPVATKVMMSFFS